MTIKVKIDLPKIRGKLDAAKADVFRKVEKGAQLARGEMIQRTGKGQGVDGQSFKPYSAQWAKVRKEAGAQTSRVDHFFGKKLPGSSIPSGMLRSISNRTVEFTKSKLTVKIFPDAVQRQKVAGTNRLRKWFGFGQKEIDIITKTIKGK